MPISRRVLLSRTAMLSAAPGIRARAQGKPATPHTGLHKTCVAEGTEQLFQSAGQQLRRHVALQEDRCSYGAANTMKSGRIAEVHMKSIPTDDGAFDAGIVRADGLGVFPAYLFEVETNAESKYPWNYYKLLQITPDSVALHPLDERPKFAITA